MKINEYKLETNKVINNKKLAVVSDIHINSSTEIEKLLSIKETLKKIKPTHVFIPGDLYNVDEVTLSRQVGDNIVYSFLHEVADIADIFYVKGNNEVKSSLIPYEIYNNLDPRIHLLCDTYANYLCGSRNYCNYKSINTGDMNIMGIKLPEIFYSISKEERVELLLTRYKEYLDDLAMQCNSNEYNVLLCHDSIMIDAYSEIKSLKNFDLIVSGHNHRGIYSDLIEHEYISGIIQKLNTIFLISRGVSRCNEVLDNEHESTIEIVNVYSKKR